MDPGEARNIANVANFTDPGLTERAWKHRRCYPLREPRLDRAGFGPDRGLLDRGAEARNIANVTHFAHPGLTERGWKQRKCGHFGNPGLLEPSSARR